MSSIGVSNQNTNQTVFNQIPIIQNAERIIINLNIRSNKSKELSGNSSVKKYFLLLNENSFQKAYPLSPTTKKLH